MLPRPDIVIQLDTDESKIVLRDNFGEEIYEKDEFQKKLREVYTFFHGYIYWRIIDASRSKEDVQKEIVIEIEKLIKYYENHEDNFKKNNYPNSISEDLFSLRGII